MKTLNGQMVCGISPVREEKVYGGKDLPTIRVRIKWRGGLGWVNRSEPTSNSGRFISYIAALLVPWITPCDRGFHTHEVITHRMTVTTERAITENILTLPDTEYNQYIRRHFLGPTTSRSSGNKSLTVFSAP